MIIDNTEQIKKLIARCGKDEFYMLQILHRAKDGKTPYDPEGDEWIMTKDDVKDIIVAIYALVNFHGYTADDYDAWLLEGFRLATLPNKEVGLKLFNMISEKSDNYEGINDVKEKFEECLKTTTYKTNILGYYINKIRDYYGYDWRYRVSDILKEKGIKVKL